MMVEVLAPGAWRHCGWAWMAGLALSLGLVAASSDAAYAQAEPAKAQEPEAEKTEPAADAPKAEAPAQEPEAALPDSLFYDPKAEAALENTFEPLFARTANRQGDQAVMRMARGETRVDAATLANYIEFAVHDLTSRENIDAMKTAPSTNQRSRAVELAGRRLVDPLVVPASGNNSAFRRAYVDKLLQVAPDVLKNHLYARTQLMIALSRAGDPRLVDLFVSVLDDPEQVVVAKMLAAEGLSTIARMEGRSLSVDALQKAAKSVAGFLKANPETFWMARLRAVEALGCLRVVADIQNRGQVEMAATAMGLLTDEEARPELRTAATWALGMLEIPPGVASYNYSLIAYHAGQLAASLGQELSGAEPERARYLAALLVRLYAGLNGDPSMAGSGLLNARGIDSQRPYVSQVHQLVRQLASASIALTKAPASQRAQAKQEVLGRVAALKEYLADNKPKETALVPGGPTFAVVASQAAPAQ